MPKDATVLMIRHAEKPDAGDLKSLSVAGQERAQAYVVYFQHYRTDSSRPVRLDYLFAAADSPESHRPHLTLKPLKRALGVKLHRKYSDKEYGKLAEHLKVQRKYQGCNILVCWHHEELLDFAAALGVDPSTLPPEAHWPAPPWPEDVYGWLLQLRYDPSGYILTTQTKCINEQLMYDDWGQAPTGGSSPADNGPLHG